ncbi:MAG: NAD(P)/FAD-dependent oxidoreductase, partial [Pseudomonadales bacterium]
MTNRSAADVVIIGAGVIGLSIARQISRCSKLSIVVLDKSPAVGAGSTGASSAVLRHRYSYPAMVQLARDGIHAYRHWQSFTELSAPRARFEADSVLWLAHPKSNWAAEEQQRLQAAGIRAAVLDDASLQKRYPSLNPCCRGLDIRAGEEHECQGGGEHLLELDGGHIDPMDVLQDLLEANRLKGVQVRFKTNVKTVRTQNGRAVGVSLDSGAHIDAGIVVIASGPWCNQIIQQLDFDWRWNLTPTRIQIIYRDRPQVISGAIPVCADLASGIYFRLQNRGQQLLLGSTLPEDEMEAVSNPDDFLRIADDNFMQAKLHALHHRLPALPYRGNLRSYCGLYTVNRDDM